MPKLKFLLALVLVAWVLLECLDYAMTVAYDLSSR